ncbi:glycosyltransferase family 1 protein [Flagellimonas sp. DF-77]|uniref:glycosyltransferase family 4 protein n=1 Tax=Flagellimonas algarum TaxID=3230298 RepID=UPI003394531D
MLGPKYGSHQFYIFLNKEDFEKEFPFQAANVHLVYVKRVNNLLSNTFVLPKYHKKLNLDVTLFQNFGPLFPAVNSIVYIHDLLFLDYPGFFSLKEKIYLRLIVPLAKKAKSLVTISATEKERIIAHGLAKRNNVHFVHHGVSKEFRPASDFADAELVKTQKDYGLPNGYVLFLGRLNIRKNIKSLLIAMKDVDVPLVIAGANSHKTEDLEEVIANNGLKHKVIFTGHIADGDLPKVYALATVFCFPSFAEGFGLPPLEAMASGVPVVSSDRTSLKEVCGSAALFIDPDRPEAIAKALNTLLHSPAKRERLIAEGHHRAAQFNWDKASRELMRIIEKV